MAVAVIRYVILVTYFIITTWLYASTKLSRHKKLITRKQAMKRYIICLVMWGVPALLIYGAAAIHKYILK